MSLSHATACRKQRDPELGDGEIFFHFSEVNGDVQSLRLGMDVDYVEVKQGKDKLRAVDVRPLPPGFFDVVDEVLSEGIVTHAISSGRKGTGEYVLRGGWHFT